MKSATATIILLMFCVTARADVVYVDANAAGANDGTSWDGAFVKLQDALTISVDGDEIWVARGIYRRLHTAPDPPVFVIPEGVKVFWRVQWCRDQPGPARLEREPDGPHRRDGAGAERGDARRPGPLRGV